MNEYKKLAKLYDDKGLLKSLEGKRWCSKERYDKHEDTREMFYVASKKSLSFCNYWFGEAMKSSEKYNDSARTLMLRRLELNPKQICADDVKGNYDLGSTYRKYSIGLTQKK